MKAQNAPFDAESTLAAIYEEVMWLARRPHTTPSDARAWYTHVASVRLRRNLRIFSGRVSQQALLHDAVPQLEHFKRLQTTLTKLVSDHLRDKTHDPRHFIRVVTDCEQVHIVTRRENYDARKASGDYAQAGIVLLEWQAIPPEAQLRLYKRVLRGKVSNSHVFNPNSTNPA